MPNTMFITRNLEAHENLMVTDTVQCKSFYKYEIPGHSKLVSPEERNSNSQQVPMFSKLESFGEKQ